MLQNYLHVDLTLAMPMAYPLPRGVESAEPLWQNASLKSAVISLGNAVVGRPPAASCVSAPSAGRKAHAKVWRCHLLPMSSSSILKSCHDFDINDQPDSGDRILVSHLTLPSPC